MSSLLVRIAEFDRLEHPNADSLFVAAITGTAWRCCARKADFENSREGVYIPVDSLIPVNLADELKLPNSVDGRPHRVRTIRLRGLLSQGLLLPNRWGFKPGDDVAGALGITKHVEPEPVDEDLRNFPETFVTYTDIENVNNFPGVLQEGEQVVITEKIHGVNFRAAFIDGEFWIGTKSAAWKPSASSKWHQVAAKYSLAEKLRGMPGTVVFGELYGTGVQALRYGLDDCNDMRLFDAYRPDSYLDHADFGDLAAELGVPAVPMLYAGPYSDAVLAQYTSGPSVLGQGAHIREGVVVRPCQERWDFDHGLGRVILKSVCPNYLLKQYD